MAYCLGLLYVFTDLGFMYLSPFLKKHIGLHDTCGVLNLHGIPGVMGGFASAVACSWNSKHNFGARHAD